MIKKHKANIAYDLERVCVPYQETTPFYLSDNGTSRASTFAGEDIDRYRTVYNSRISFWYFAKKNSLSDYTGRFACVNNSDIVVAGINIPKHKGLIVDLDIRTVAIKYKGSYIDCFKHNVTIELEVEKPLLSTTVPVKGFYFKHPVTGRPARIQFSSDPDSLVNYKHDYPLAVHVGNGLGFYSDARADLNVPYACYLKEDGGIALNDSEIAYIKCTERQVGDWNCLGLPKVARDPNYYEEQVTEE